MTVVLPVTGVNPVVTFSEALNRHLFMPNDNKIAEVKKLTVADKAWIRARFREEYGYSFVDGNGAVISE